MARRSDGSAVGWGYNGDGQCNVPALPPGISYVGISAGGGHGLATRSDGSAVAWGSNFYGQCNVPALPPGLSYVEVAGGGAHSLARRSDGSVVGWGDNSSGQCNVPALPPGLSYTQIAAGTFFSVALRSDGSVLAWGSNGYGQCNVPALPFGLTYVEIAAGHQHSVARRSDGSVVAWGNNGYGQCSVPVLVPGEIYVAISAGGVETVARVESPPGFTPFCFGDGSGAACPCGNSGATGHGCQNSAGTGGAILTASGDASLSADTVQFISTGELSTALSIVLQGNSAILPHNFGDGLRCVGGTIIRRLYVRSAAGGVVLVPQGGDPSVSARSAVMGDLIPLGATRNYQVYYRDPSATFCASPPGGTFNVSRAIAVVWGS